MAGSSSHRGMRTNSSRCLTNETLVTAPDIQIRAMAEADLPAVQALHLDSWRHSYAGLKDDAFLDGPVVDEMAGRWRALPSKDDVALVAEQEGEIVALALVFATHPEGPLLESLHVRSDQQGKGVGRRLVSATTAELAARGYDTLWLEVIAGNRAARTIYAKWGGVESWPFKDVIAGQEVSAVKVRWSSLTPLIALG